MPFPWPEWLLFPDKLEETVMFILAAPVDREIVRKYMIIEWCKLTGTPLTAELVDRVYAE